MVRILFEILARGLYMRPIRSLNLLLHGGKQCLAVIGQFPRGAPRYITYSVRFPNTAHQEVENSETHLFLRTILHRSTIASTSSAIELIQGNGAVKLPTSLPVAIPTLSTPSHGTQAPMQLSTSLVSIIDLLSALFCWCSCCSCCCSLSST